MIKVEKGVENRTLAEIAQKHWEIINPKHQEEGYYLIEESLIGRITSKRNFHNINGDARADFYDWLLDQNFAYLKKLIKSTVAEFRAIIDEVTDFITARNLHQGEPWNAFRDELLSVFAYENWRSNGKGMRLYRLLEYEICPYCNLESIGIDDDQDKLVASYDHYYLKSDYPYLSMSFSNLIPVCKKCNETYKLDLNFCLSSHVHPYHDDYNSLCYMECELMDDNKNYEVNIYLHDQNDHRSHRFNNELSFTARYNHPSVTQSAKTVVSMIKRHYGLDSRIAAIKEYGLTMEEYVSSICDDLSIPYDKDKILGFQYGKLKRDVAIQTGLLDWD